jgi:large subunit ribosomal protein L20
MPRVKRGTVRRAKRKKLLKLAKGYYANKSKLYRAAKESVDTALKYAFVGRRRKKRDFRRLWVVRINAAAREHGLTYGQMINGLKNAGITLDRKSLSELAISSPSAFATLAKQAKGRGEDRGQVGEERRKGGRVESRQRQGRGARLTTGTRGWGLGASKPGLPFPAPSP